MDNYQIEQIYKELVNDIYRYSFYKLRVKEQAEEVVSETFLRFIESEKKESIDKKELKVWVIGIARNIIYEKYREIKKFGSVDLEETYMDIVDQVKSLENVVIDSELEELIREKLEDLDDATREVIVLKTWEELNFKEISRILDLGENTVKAIYYRGLEKVKKQLESKTEVKARVLTLPILLTGIVQVGKHVDLLPNQEISTKIFGLLQSSNLLLSTNIMDNVSNIANSVGSAGAQAASSTGIAGVASTAAGTVAKTTFLGTTLGKVIIGAVTTTAVVGGGVGGFFAYNEIQKDSTKAPGEPIVSYPVSQGENNTGNSSTQIEWETCQNESLKLSAQYPSTWTCESTTNYGQGSMAITSEDKNTVISINFPGIGACVTCDVEEYYKNTNTDIRKYFDNGILHSIFGVWSAEVNGTKAAYATISVKLPNDLSGDLDKTVKDIVDSIGVIGSTTGMKTYTDNSGYYSFSYPGNLLVSESNGSIYLKNDPNGCTWMSVKVAENPTNLSEKDFISAGYQALGGISVTEANVYTIDGSNYQSYRSTSGNFVAEDIPIRIGNKYIVITFNTRCTAATEGQYGSVDSSIVSQIISSFKINEPDTNAYTDKNGYYTFSYPLTLQTYESNGAVYLRNDPNGCLWMWVKVYDDPTNGDLDQFIDLNFLNSPVYTSANFVKMVTIDGNEYSSYRLAGGNNNPKIILIPLTGKMIVIGSEERCTAVTEGSYGAVDPAVVDGMIKSFKF